MDEPARWDIILLLGYCQQSSLHTRKKLLLKKSDPSMVHKTLFQQLFVSRNTKSQGSNLGRKKGRRRTFRLGP